MSSDLSEQTALNWVQDEALRLHQISTLLIQERDPHSLYLRILDAAVDLLSSDMGSMQVFHPERNELRLLASKGFHPQSAAFWEWVRLEFGSSCAAALSAGAGSLCQTLRRVT